jgi:2-C-methyl-D-erythritol 2,4-cyclodiphosphate synthase
MKIGIGEDAHEFEETATGKPCIIGGVVFSQEKGFDADSDGDVLYHSLCQALTCIHHEPILGGAAIKMCRAGQKDSSLYVLEALKYLEGQQIEHVSFSIEASRPRLQSQLLQMRKNVAKLLDIKLDQVGVVCTSGNNLSLASKGRGVRAICNLISTHRD